MADEGVGEVTPAAPAAPAGEVTPAASWRDGLDAEIRDHPNLARIADVPALARSFLETREHVGKKGIILPKEGDAADLARFNLEIGVPPTPEEYDLGDFTPPEGLPWSETLQTVMLGKLHARGVPQSQIRGLFDDLADAQNDEYIEMVGVQKKGHESGMAKLKETLGVDYEPSIALAERAFKRMAGDNFEAVNSMVLADGTRVWDHPDFVSLFIKVGKTHREHKIEGETEGGGFTKTVESAKEEIAKLENHPAWRNADDPEHAIIQSQMDALYLQAYPEQKPEVL